MSGYWLPERRFVSVWGTLDRVYMNHMSLQVYVTDLANSFLLLEPVILYCALFFVLQVTSKEKT